MGGAGSTAKRRILAAGLAACLAAALAAACADGGGGGDAGGDAGADGGGDTDPWGARFDPFVAALRADLAASDAYGVSAAVLEDGVVTFAQAFGAKDPDGLEPLTPDTLMQIGSTTKQMTAAALLQKVAADACAVGDTVEALLPDLELALDPGWDDQLTVHHLLSHQGGFYDWLPWDGPADDGELAALAYGGFADEIFPMSPPGAFWNYSNPNFVIAGLITEELDTRPWPDIMAEDVFAPLGMPRTFLRKAEVEADGDYALSYGYGVDDLETGELGPVAMADMPDPAFARPAGLVWTTPAQQLAWASFLLDGDPGVLDDELRAALTAEQVDTLYSPGYSFYGYGVFVDRGYWSLAGDWHETPVWSHGGNTLSFTNILVILPERRFAVAITSSAYGTDFNSSADVALTTLADLPAPSTGPQFPVDPAAFDGYVGLYTDPYNVGDMIVTREGDALLVEMPALTMYGYDVTPELVPVQAAVFLLYIDDYPYDLTFVAAAAGEPARWVRNRSFVVARVEESPDGGVGFASEEARPAPSHEAVARWIRQARLSPAPLAAPRGRTPSAPTSPSR